MIKYMTVPELMARSAHVKVGTEVGNAQGPHNKGYIFTFSTALASTAVSAISLYRRHMGCREHGASSCSSPAIWDSHHHPEK